jgi:predicted Fe-Mo cluster-binding NifX family protein
MNAQGTGRKIAVTVWGQRVSPVFDSARTLLIAEVNGKSLTGTFRIAFDPERLLELLHLLRAQQVTLIVCGAVSEGPAAMIEAAGVELIPFIAGEVHQVLEHYLQGRPFDQHFRMPGCGKNICCRGRIRRGRGIQTFQQQLDRSAFSQSSSDLAVVDETAQQEEDLTATTKISQEQHSPRIKPTRR